MGELPANVLGVTDTVGGFVTISANASGQGWFVDPTPGQDEEFGSDGVARRAHPRRARWIC